MGENGMRTCRGATAFIVVMLSMSLGWTTIASAQSKDDSAKASEVGVTASEVHVAIVADVDNSLAPALFRGAVLGVQGAAKYLNSNEGGGGIGGRKLVVDFIDSHLNPTDTRNAIIGACSQDFAMVGTSVIFLTNVADGTACKDQAGAATGLPDLPAFATGLAQSCSPVIFPVSGTLIDCATANQTPQTYRGNKGPALFLTKKFGKLHGVYVYSRDTADATRASLVGVNSTIQGGIAADQQVPMAGRDPQSAYTTTVTKMKQDGSNYGTAIGTTLMLNLRAEAQLQGASSDVVWSCNTCYSKELGANPVLDNTWVDSQYLPFSETAANPMMKNFVKYVGSKADSYSVSAWASTIAFADAARAVVAERGANGLTRSAFLKEGIPTLKAFNAGGIIGTVDVPAKVPSHCYVEMQLQDGKYTRVHPAKKGTFDCSPKNAAITKEDLLGR
jgi:hypothetical protein